VLLLLDLPSHPRSFVGVPLRPSLAQGGLRDAFTSSFYFFWRFFLVFCFFSLLFSPPSVFINPSDKTSFDPDLSDESPPWCMPIINEEPSFARKLLPHLGHPGNSAVAVSPNGVVPLGVIPLFPNRGLHGPQPLFAPYTFQPSVPYTTHTLI